MIAVRSGCNDSLSIMQELSYKGRVTKEEYNLDILTAILDDILLGGGKQANYF